MAVSEPLQKELALRARLRPSLRVEQHMRGELVNLLLRVRADRETMKRQAQRIRQLEADNEHLRRVIEAQRRRERG